MDALYRCFSATLDPNPNTRKAAELELRKMEPQPGMLPSAFQLLARQDIDASIRQATAVYVKNRIRRAWENKNVELVTDSKITPIPAADHDLVRAALLPTLIEALPQTRVHIAAALGAVIRSDFPQKWPGLIDDIKGLLGNGESNDVNKLSAGLTALLEVVRAFRWKDDGKVMNPIAEATFPTLLVITRTLLASPNSSNPEIGSLVYLITKIYKTSINQELSLYHQADQNIVPWGQILLQIVQKEVDPSQMPSEEDERQRCPWWKAKKWAYYSLNKLFTRFGNPSQLPSNLKDYKPFAERFIASFAPEILKVYLTQVEARVKGQLWLSDRVIHLILTFFSECVKAKSTWLLVKPNLAVLVQYFAFPLLCHKTEDDELWELDPTDFVRAQLDPMEDYGSPRASASSFFETLVQKRMKGAFLSILEFLTDILNNYPATKSPSEKEGALHLIKILENAMLSHPATVPNLEGLLIQHVVPELASPHRFLRFRAADVIAALAGKMEWKDSKNLEKTFQGIMTILGDTELPVRVQAAEAISSLVDHSEVQQAMAPNAARLMQELLKLSDEVEIDVLTQAKSRVVEAFSEELLPFSTKLCEQLAQSYYRLIGSNLESAQKAEEMGDISREMDNSLSEDRGEEDRMFAALSCLTTMYQVLASAESSPEILAQLEKIVLPVVHFTMQQGVVEMFDDCFDLTDTLSFYQKKISDDMWNIFRLMYTTFKHDGIDYLSEMLSTFDNVITYGSTAFESNAELRHMILDIYNTAMTSDQLGTSDKVAACKLADVFLLVLKGSIRESIPTVIASCLSHIQNKKEKSLQKWSVLVILDALCFNTIETLQHLESSQATAAFFAIALQLLPKYTRVHDKKVIATAFMSILSLDPSQTPTSVQEGYGALVVGLLQDLVDLPKAIQKAKEEQEAFENLDDDDAGDMSGSYNAHDDSKDADGDVVDEENEYLELLAKEGARLRSQMEGGDPGTADDSLDEDGFEDEDDDDDDEDGVFVSPMNSVPVFDGLRNLLATSQKFQQVASSLPAQDQQLLQTVSQFKDEELPLPYSVPVA